jgi:hypothetical protein
MMNFILSHSRPPSQAHFAAQPSHAPTLGESRIQDRLGSGSLLLHRLCRHRNRLHDCCCSGVVDHLRRHHWRRHRHRHLLLLRLHHRHRVRRRHHHLLLLHLLLLHLLPREEVCGTKNDGSGGGGYVR